MSASGEVDKKLLMMKISGYTVLLFIPQNTHCTVVVVIMY